MQSKRLFLGRLLSVASANMAETEIQRKFTEPAPSVDDYDPISITGNTLFNCDSGALVSMCKMLSQQG